MPLIAWITRALHTPVQAGRLSSRDFHVLFVATCKTQPAPFATTMASGGAGGSGSSREAGHVQLPSPLPKVVVFDLDMCVWSPEMYELSRCPSHPVRGDLAGRGEGVAGLRCGKHGETVRVFPGALVALQELYEHPGWKGVKVAAASSSEEPSYSAACMRTLEFLPGVTLDTVFADPALRQIGRTGKLSSDKRTHMAEIRKASGIDYEHYLFFDDCNWGDHVGRLEKSHGIVGQRTPRGLTEAEWRAAVEKFAKARKAS